MKVAEGLSIGKLSGQSGVNIETIRYYEKIGYRARGSRAVARSPRIQGAPFTAPVRPRHPIDRTQSTMEPHQARNRDPNLQVGIASLASATGSPKGRHS
jgi:hypothetical protein